MNPKHKRQRRFLTHTVVAVTCGIVFLCGVRWAALQAAEPPKTPGETKQAPPVAVALADSEIIPRADQTVKSLQKLRSEIAADSTLNAIQRAFAAFAEKSDRRRENDAEMMTKSRSVQRLNEIAREWSLEQSQLNDWDQALARKSQILVAQGKDIDQIMETWRATRVAVAKKFLFKAVLQRRVEEVLREAQATRLAVQEQTSKLLKLQSQVADRLATLAKIRTEIDQAREEFSRGLFALDSPSLWQALFHPEAQDTILAEASDSARRMLDDLQEFLQRYRERIASHLVFFLLLVAVFYFLRRGLTPDRPERLGTVTAIFVLDHPFSSSLLLALISSGLFYPGAATGILRTAIVPTVISVIGLLPGLLPQISQRWVYLLAVLYVLEFFRYLLPEDWLLTRVLLLLIATGGCVGLGLFLRSAKTQLSGSSSRRLILVVARFVLFLFAVGVVSNLVGNMTLADILVVAPLRIIYAGALIYTGAQLLMTLTVVGLQSRAARLLRGVREHGELLASRCRVMIRIAAGALWVGTSLYMVGVLGDIWAAGAEFLQLRWKLGATEISIEGLAVFLAVLVSAIFVSRLLRFILTEEIFPRIELPRGVPGAVDVLSRYGIMLLGFFIALAAAGVDLSKVTLLISALGVGIGFGLQNVVNNFVSGLILVFEHPVQVGDSVEVGTVFGEVRKIGFRASVLRTPDGAEVIVPNSELTGSRVINWSLSDRFRRISIPVSVAYGTDPNRVIDILLGIARKHPDVLAQPAPLAVFDRFGDSALVFTLLCWSFVDRFFIARSDLTIAINNSFKEAGIEIPFPQQDVHVHWPVSVGAAGKPPEPSKDATQSKSV
ncbi:MAG TPA: mechanosensitive ion channel domain-containing protein, partial [Candidatus Binatia bacterium]